MIFNRYWAWPSADTFDIPPIGGFVKSYLRKSQISVDPFARNKTWFNFTNDLNPKTSAEYHMDAEAFLLMLGERGTQADLIIFDPPYSPRQIKECYEGFGREVTNKDTQNGALYNRVRRAIDPILAPNGYVLSFGWNTQGMSHITGLDYTIEEIVLVCHGVARNDTICMAEKKSSQISLFTPPTDR